MQPHRGAPGQQAGRPDPGRLSPDRIALFLDVDGTLIELAARPDAVVVEPATRELLRGLSLVSGGAVALISGRSIAVLDELFEPLLLPAAGLHGFERRNANGAYTRFPAASGQGMERARRMLGEVAARNPRVLVEDKRYSVALHYRQAPELEDEIVSDVTAIARHAGPELGIQRGRMVIELLPSGVSKATAVAEFMDELPFSGRTPVYVGDDLTDESAFRWVNEQGGLSVAVNVSRETAAVMHLASVADTRAWLNSLLLRGD